MEIQNFISVFKSDSDSEELFDEAISSMLQVLIFIASVVRITSLEQSISQIK